MMTAGDEAFFKAIVFLDYFADLPDPRQLVKVICPLDEVLLSALLAVLAGAETFTDIARFGDYKLDLLRRFRPFQAERRPEADFCSAVDSPSPGRQSARNGGGHDERTLSIRAGSG